MILFHKYFSGTVLEDIMHDNEKKAQTENFKSNVQ